MNTSTPTDPRSLAHRLTTVGHALHHRLFAQLRDSDVHPKTVLVLSVIDGRLDAPWISDRIARGGKRVSALADRGWITPTDDGWALTDEGRQVLDRVDAARQALLAEVPAEEIQRLTAALDAVSAAIGLDEDEAASGPRGFRPGPFRPGFGRGFGPGPHGGFGGPRFGGGEHRGFGGGEHRGFGGGEHRGFGGGERHGFGGPRFDEDQSDGDRHRGHHGHGHGHDHEHGRRHERGHRAAERAYERGFDAGFRRGRDSSASE